MNKLVHDRCNVFGHVLFPFIAANSGQNLAVFIHFDKSWNSIYTKKGCQLLMRINVNLDDGGILENCGYPFIM